ncbi:MAG: hypothetical protein D6760_11680 [Deltaproteobacteria bacterium]|nr:MAG: hypothetical protein D6760_11680 [Deltaproteobacteria bacterium]
MHDVVRFEQAGIPTANVGTDGFVDEAEEQARLLGMEGYPMVWVPHPVAVLDEGEIRKLARRTAGRVVAVLTGA